MGSNLARNLASREGNTVAVYNRTFARTNTLVTEHPEAGFVAAESIDDFVASLATPRTAIIMVQAGAGTDAVISELAQRFEPGDIIVDGGNALFTDTIRREQALAATGIHFVGAGISGGEEGALKGPSIMPGGSVESYKTLGPILESIAAIAEGEPCVTHVGTDGAGHFVKMIHNGIEYADMQLIAEAYDILRNAGGFTPSEIAGILTEWNKGELNSYLIDITEQIFTKKDEETGKPLVDLILDKAGQKGTGKWTVGNAVEHGVVLSTVNAAVEARILSSMKAKRVTASGILPGWTAPAFTGDRAQFINDVRDALYASKIVSYAQGLDLLGTASKFYGWNLNFGDIATIWRGGCIIRAAFLNRIKEAYEANPNLENLMLAPFFTEVFAKSQAGWRRAIAAAVERGVAAPAFTASLGYYDSYRSAVLPANLLQAQRDFFGAHTYERVDKPEGEFFHTNWTGHGGTTASTTYTA